MGFSLVRYNTYTEQVKLINEGKKLVDVLQLAKKKALSSDLLITPAVAPASPTYCENFMGYKVSFNSNNYSLKYCCDDFLCPTNINTYLLNANITISPLPADINFPRLMEGIDYKTGLVPGIIIQIRNSIINKCVNISVSQFGVIELNESLVTCI